MYGLFAEVKKDLKSPSKSLINILSVFTVDDISAGFKIDILDFFPASVTKNSLWFKIKAKFYSMQQKPHRGFEARAYTSVECMRHALYQESYLSGLLHME